MITIESAESALKNVYLDAVINELNTKTNPFLTMIADNSKKVMGKDIKCSVRYGDNGNVAAAREDADLPVSTNSKYAEIVAPLKNLYGTFQISDKAIKASQTNHGAFTNLLDAEMSNLISAAKVTLNSMIYGNGMTLLSHATRWNFSGSDKKLFVPAGNVENFKQGAKFSLFNANNEAINTGDLTVTAINLATGEVTFTGTVKETAQDRLYAISSESINDRVAISGIDALFMQDGKLYNLDIAAHRGIKPFLSAHDKAGTDHVDVINEDTVIAFLDSYEEHCSGTAADILLTHPGVRKALFENLKANRSNIDVTEIAGGFKGFSFNGIPLYADVKCKGGTLYALNSDSFSMYELCDWSWLAGDDGSILKQIDKKAAYNATLVKYAELICERPFLQGKLTGYSAKRWNESQKGADFRNVD